MIINKDDLLDYIKDKSLDIAIFNEIVNLQRLQVTEKEKFLRYIEESHFLMKVPNYIIELKIQMPTGEIETIINPNISSKVEYIKKAYDDNLHLNMRPEIYIIDYNIHLL